MLLIIRAIWCMEGVDIKILIMYNGCRSWLLVLCRAADVKFGPLVAPANARAYRDFGTINLRWLRCP
jgi:hypothetical protein